MVLDSYFPFLSLKEGALFLMPRYGFKKARAY